MIAGDSAKANALSDRLFERGVFAQAIAFPTVARDKARVRTIVTATHTREDLQYALDMFASRAGDRLWSDVQRPAPRIAPRSTLVRRGPATRARRHAEDLQRLFTHDTRDAYRFFARGSTRIGSRALPWWKRLPLRIRQIFVAFTLKLPPARRSLYLISLFVALHRRHPAVPRLRRDRCAVRHCRSSRSRCSRRTGPTAPSR